jgi:aminoglycoside N3'-acetyltransferase
VRYRRPAQVTIVRNGRPTRHDYREIDHCCVNFNLLDMWLEAPGRQHPA